MERTRGMSLSEDEKESLRTEELEKKARGFRLRLLEDPDRMREILLDLEKEPDENRELLRRLLWKNIVKGLDVSDELFKSLDLLEALPQADDKTSVLKQARAAVNAAIKDRAKDRKKILNRERKRLAAFGISGSAVVPKMPKDGSYEAGVAEVVAEYKKKLLEDLPA